MTIKDFADEAYEIAVEHGWYENGVTLPEAIVSIHCEASEAFQEWRQGHLTTETYTGADGKPEGVPMELADIVIRVFSFCAGAGIDIEKALEEKQAYNRTRPYRHGGKLM